MRQRASAIAWRRSASLWNAAAAETERLRARLTAPLGMPDIEQMDELLLGERDSMFTRIALPASCGSW